MYALWRELTAADVAAAEERRARAVAPARGRRRTSARSWTARSRRDASRTSAAPARRASRPRRRRSCDRRRRGSLAALVASLLEHASRPLHLWVLARPGTGEPPTRLAARFPRLAFSWVPLRGLGAACHADRRAAGPGRGPAAAPRTAARRRPRSCCCRCRRWRRRRRRAGRPRPRRPRARRAARPGTPRISGFGVHPHRRARGSATGPRRRRRCAAPPTPATASTSTRSRTSVLVLDLDRLRRDGVGDAGAAARPGLRARRPRGAALHRSAPTGPRSRRAGRPCRPGRPSAARGSCTGPTGSGRGRRCSPRSAIAGGAMPPAESRRRRLLGPLAVAAHRSALAILAALPRPRGVRPLCGGTDRNCASTEGSDPGPVRFLLAHAWGMGGTIRTTLTVAEHLADRRGVEVVSVFRRRERPFFRLAPACACARSTTSGGGAACSARLPSLLVHPEDYAYPWCSLRTDLALLRWLRSLDGGVLVTTRPAFNLLAARLAPPGRRDDRPGAPAPRCPPAAAAPPTSAAATAASTRSRC